MGFPYNHPCRLYQTKNVNLKLLCVISPIVPNLSYIGAALSIEPNTPATSLVIKKDGLLLSCPFSLKVFVVIAPEAPLALAVRRSCHSSGPSDGGVAGGEVAAAVVGDV